MSKDDNVMLVRIKPRAGVQKRSGAPLPKRRYMCMEFGIRFLEERGWYKVDQKVADYVSQVHEVHHDETTPFLFDVCTEEEAKRLDAREAEAALRGSKAPAVKPNLPPRVATAEALAAQKRTGSRNPEGGGDLTTDDLTRGTSRHRARGARAAV